MPTKKTSSQPLQEGAPKVNVLPQDSIEKTWSSEGRNTT